MPKKVVAKKASPVPKMHAQLVKLHANVQRKRDKLLKWGDPAREIVKALNEAVNDLAAAVGELDAIPTNFSPSGRPPKARLEPGIIVSIRDARKENYADLLEAKDMVDLTILKANGSKLVCKTKEGTKLFLPKGHVYPVEVTSEEAT